MKCACCGRELLDGAKFCVKCGAPVAMQATVDEFAYLANYKKLQDLMVSIRDLKNTARTETQCEMYEAQMRKALEWMVNELFEKNHLGMKNEFSLFDKINALSNRGIIDRASLDAYHQIRKVGNRGAHAETHASLNLNARLAQDHVMYALLRTEAQKYATNYALSKVSTSCQNTKQTVRYTSTGNANVPARLRSNVVTHRVFTILFSIVAIVSLCIAVETDSEATLVFALWTGVLSLIAFINLLVNKSKVRRISAGNVAGVNRKGNTMNNRGVGFSQHQQFMDQANQQWFMNESLNSVTPFEHGGYDMSQGNSFNMGCGGFGMF